MTAPEQGSRFSGPLKRIVVACVLLFAGWVLFMQMAPRLMLSIAPPPPPVEHVEAKPSQSIPPPPPAPAPASPPVVLKVEPPKPPEPAPEPKPESKAEAPANSNIQPLEEKIAAQAEAIKTLQHQQEQASRTLALLDAYDRLKEAALSGKPYTDEAAHLHALAGDDAGIAEAMKPLDARAKDGIPRLDTLDHSFAETAQTALHPPVAAEAGFWSRFMANISAFISIRRVGDVPGNTPDAVIARAENALHLQDVERAISELGGLNGDAAIAMQPWRNTATAYVEREHALAALKSAIVAPHAP